MAVTARFYVDEITRKAGMDFVEVKLRASTKGEGNKTWAKYTPVGNITLSINNPAAAAWFEENFGKDVSLVFDAVE